MRFSKDWEITIDTIWDASLQMLSDAMLSAFNEGENITKDAEDYADFTNAIAHLLQGRIAPHTLRPMALDTEEEGKPIKGCYVLQIPGTNFKGYFKLDFATLKGKAIFALRSPATQEQKDAIRRRFSLQ